MTKTAKSTQLLKKYISEKYSMKVSAKSDKYSGGSSLRVSYNLGLCTDIIDSDLSRLEYGKFDGMIDLYEYKNDAETGITIDGFELEEYKYISVDREISDEFKLKMIQAYFTKFSFNGVEVPQTVKDIHETNIEFRDNFGHWTLSQYFYQICSKFNFLTNNESDIERVWFEDQSLNSGKKVMHYEMNGKICNTKQTEIQKELKTVKREAVINQNGVQMVDYSEKAIAVIGNTFEIKEHLKELGGRFNRFLTVDGEKVAGWIFSKNLQNEVSDLLINYSYL